MTKVSITFFLLTFFKILDITYSFFTSKIYNSFIYNVRTMTLKYFILMTLDVNCHK